MSNNGDWKARLADCIAAGFVGWCLFSTFHQKILPSIGPLDRSLLLLLFSLACSYLGLFLPSIFSFLERRGIPSRRAALAVRFSAAGAVGAYAIAKFVEGCAAGLAVVCFGVFLWILLRALDTSRKAFLSNSFVPRKVISLQGGASVGGQLNGVGGAVLAPGISGKFLELFAMAASGVTTGLLAGCGRAAIGIDNLSEHAEIFCLFPICVILLGLLIRLLSVRVIQGKDQLGGWKTVLAIADGLTVSILIAIATSTEVPPAVSWDGSVSKNQLLWIPVGLALGFTWGVVFGSVKILLTRTVQAFLSRVLSRDVEAKKIARLDSPWISESESDRPRLDSVEINEQLKVANSSDHLDGPEETEERTRAEGSTTSSRLGCPCSCLLAGSALAASMFFALMASMGACENVKSNADIERLPKGCPKDCEAAVLDGFKLAGVDFSGANLSRAKLREAWLDKANLRNAVLRDALLFRADLRDADLSGADLSGADLRRTILLKARFENTKLRGAYLRNATLQDVDLSTADLEGADLRDAAYSEKTKWPPGFDLQGAGLRLDD